MLLFNSKLQLFSAKLKSKWSWTFSIEEIKPYGSIELEEPTTKRTWIVNGQILKPYDAMCSCVSKEIIGSKELKESCTKNGRGKVNE